MERPGVDRLTGQGGRTGKAAGVRFREVQRFRQPWLVALLSFLFAITLWGFVQQIVLGIPWGNNPAPDWFMVLLPVVMGATVLFFLFVLRLETEVGSCSLSYRLFPLHLRPRRVPAGDIVEHKAIEYRPLHDFGGWGIRYGRMGTAYTVSGKEGVLITTANGRRTLIGSRQATELDMAVGMMRGVHFIGEE